MNYWPRSWYNYPIILFGIVIQYVWAIALIWDQRVLDITTVAPLLPRLHPFGEHSLYNSMDHHPAYRWGIIVILVAIASISAMGFFFDKKMHTLYALVPQQFVLCVSSVGAIHAMIVGHFADGTVRSNAFLFADQAPIVLLTIFHTWAMFLILKHAGDKD
jgi:hypothetical protein